MEHTPNSPEKEYSFLDRKSPEILSLLENAPLYRKYGTVKARTALAGEKISTILEDGTIETADNVAKMSDFIITNPSGEEYIISTEKLGQRYDSTDEDGIYKAKGYCKAIKNPYDKPIEILASWGEPQIGDADCMIADTCDLNGIVDGEPYIIQLKAFVNTYTTVED